MDEAELDAVGRSGGSRPRRCAGDVRVRAEDRRPGDEPALRERQVRAGGDTRRRPVGEDVTANVATIAALPKRLAKGRAGGGRGARRGVHADRQLRGAQRARRRGRAAAVRQPAQRRRRQPAPEGSADHRQPRAELLVLPARRGDRRARVHQPSRDARVPRRRSAFPVNPEIRVVDDLAGVYAFAGHWQEHRHDLPYEIDGVVAKVDESGAARAARLHLAGAAVGHRLQVPAGGAHDRAARHPGVGRSHRSHHAVRRARAGVRRRLHRADGDAAQRGSGPRQGRAPRRHGDRAQGRRRHPRGRRAGPVAATRRTASRGSSRRSARARWQPSSCAPRAKPTRDASSRRARSSATSGSSTSPRAARWTSRVSASARSSNSAMPASSPIRPTSTR